MEKKKGKKKNKVHPFELLCRYHPLLKKFSPYLNYELLMRNIKEFEKGEIVYR